LTIRATAEPAFISTSTMAAGSSTLHQEINQHNRACWLAAGSALFVAWLSWVFIYGLFAAVGLLINSMKNGIEAPPPPWLHWGLITLAIFSLLWAMVDSWLKRNRTRKERSIIGWHLVPDLILLPARLTFAIADQLQARINLTAGELEATWRLLGEIRQAGRYPVEWIQSNKAAPGLAQKAVESLQVLGWVDMLGSEGNWFYRVRSIREQEYDQISRGK